MGDGTEGSAAECGFLVSGRVQGVGFRWWTARVAHRLALAGFVRNLPDGRVEVQARGPEADLARLRDFLVIGPPLARVAQVQSIAASGSFPYPFRIA